MGLQRKDMPVEIIAEFDTCRKIRDWQGASGWVYQGPPRQAQLHHPVQGRQVVHKTPVTSAEVIAKLEPEVMGEIRSCQGDRRRVKVSSVTGWLQLTDGCQEVRAGQLDAFRRAGLGVVA